jgi:hypothetical protein
VSNQPAAAEPDAFAGARERFQTILSWLDGDQSTRLDHAELERQLDVEGRQLLRQLLQDHVDLRAMREKRIDVLDADGARRSRVETGHTRGLATIFGDGNVHQIQRIQAEANARGVPVAIVVDFVHVLEYLWRAAWSFARHPLLT